MRALTLIVALLVGGPAAAGERLAVGPAEFVSVLPTGTTASAVHVARFLMDSHPVTNAEYLSFVAAHPQWRRGSIAKLFADGDYLSHWAGAESLGASALPEQPVTRVSWYAARAYCAASGGRLPSWYEWELAAAADESLPDARHDAHWRARILDWYATAGARAARGRLRPGLLSLILGAALAPQRRPRSRVRMQYSSQCATRRRCPSCRRPALLRASILSFWTRAASSFAPCLAAASERYLAWRSPQTFTCHEPARLSTSIFIFIAGLLSSARPLRRRRPARGGLDN